MHNISTSKVQQNYSCGTFGFFYGHPSEQVGVFVFTHFYVPAAITGTDTLPKFQFQTRPVTGSRVEGVIKLSSVTEILNTIEMRILNVDEETKNKKPNI